MKEQTELLEQPVHRPIINVYLGTPGRIKALCEAKAIQLDTKKLKTIVFDCEPNSKGFTLFETHETRDDTFACFVHAESQIMRRKCKLYMANASQQAQINKS